MDVRKSWLNNRERPAIVTKGASALKNGYAGTLVTKLGRLRVSKLPDARFLDIIVTLFVEKIEGWRTEKRLKVTRTVGARMRARVRRDPFSLRVSRRGKFRRTRFRKSFSTKHPFPSVLISSTAVLAFSPSFLFRSQKTQKK